MLRSARPAGVGILRGVDAGAQTGVDAGRERGQKAFEVGFVLGCADLDFIAARQQIQFVADGAQVFEPRFDAFEAAHERQRAGDRLEIDVVLEQRAGEAIKAPGVLAERRVFELDHVDAAEQDFAADDPLDFGRMEFVHGVRSDGGEVRIEIVAAHDEFGAVAERTQFFVGGEFVGIIEHHDAWTSHERASSRSVLYMKTAPPWVGGTIG